MHPAYSIKTFDKHLCALQIIGSLILLHDAIFDIDKKGITSYDDDQRLQGKLKHLFAVALLHRIHLL